jgi:MOSC domain-containing protein YiiM
MQMQRTRARKLAATIDGLFRTQGEGFATVPVDHLDLGFDGIDGDRHGGMTRRSGGRQLSLLAADELAEAASALAIPEIRPEWIGGNLLVGGIPHLTWLPPRTLLMFAGGVTLRIDGDNGPCRSSGAAIASHYPDRGDIELGFVKAAMHRRGLVAWVEKPGRITVGEAVEARIPEQWIYA